MSNPTYVGKTLKPIQPDQRRSAVSETPGFGVEVVKGGGEGCRIFLGKGDGDPFEEESPNSESFEALPGAMQVAEFDTLGVEWPDIGLASTSGVKRQVEIRIFRQKAIGHVKMNAADLAQVSRQLVQSNNHTAMGGNLAAQAAHVIFDTTNDYIDATSSETLRPDRITDPGPTVPFRTPSGWIYVVLGASAVSSITVAPFFNVYAYGQQASANGNRYPVYSKQLDEVSTLGGGGFSATSWEYSLMYRASGAVLLPFRIPAPPNGYRLEIFNDDAANAIQWEAYVYECAGY